MGKENVTEKDAVKQPQTSPLIVGRITFNPDDINKHIKKQLDHYMRIPNPPLRSGMSVSRSDTIDPIDDPLNATPNFFRSDFSDLLHKIELQVNANPSFAPALYKLLHENEIQEPLTVQPSDLPEATLAVDAFLDALTHNDIRVIGSYGFDLVESNIPYSAKFLAVESRRIYVLKCNIQIEEVPK